MKLFSYEFEVLVFEASAASEEYLISVETLEILDINVLIIKLEMAWCLLGTATGAYE